MPIVKDVMLLNCSRELSLSLKIYKENARILVQFNRAMN